MKRALALGVLAALAGCATQTAQHPPLIAAPATCLDIHFPIYFEQGSASVTPEAERLIADAQRRSAGCAVTRIDVLGLADSPGGPVVNMELSQDRAAAVTEALARHGFPKALVQQAAAGETGALTPSGAARPLRRRANVTIHLAPQGR